LNGYLKSLSKKIKKPNYLGFILRQLGHLISRSAAFRPLLTEGLALSGLSFLLLSFFFGRPLKHLSQRGDLKLLMELTFKRRIPNCIDEVLRVFLHPPPPFSGKRKLNKGRWVDDMIQKLTLLSIGK
jgi:hypothetical protein